MKKLIASVVLFILVFSTTAYALGIEDMLGGFTSMFAPDADKAYGPRELVELDDVNIEMINVIENANSSMYQLPDGYEYIIIEFAIENKTDKDLTLSSMMSFSTWCDGELCTISIEALGTAMFAGKIQLDCVVESGKSVTGVIGYEVPVDWNEIIVQYKGDSIIGKTVDFAIEK